MAFIAEAPIAIRFVPVAALLLAVLRPRLVGAAAVTAREAKVDSLIEGLDPTSISNASTRVELLQRIPDLAPTDAARLVAARLKLWAAARRFDASVVASTTPAEHFDRSALRFLREAQWRRVTAWRPRLSAWDEDTALRAFHEDSQDLMPRDVYGQEPPIEVGLWVVAVEDLLSDLAVAPFRDSVAREAREHLIEAIRATLTTALDDRSDTAKERQALGADAMIEAWKRMATRLEQLRSASDIPRR